MRSSEKSVGLDELPSFGQLLRELRLAAGLSQEALAESARMSSGGISLLERGLRRAPYRETVALLAESLQLSARDRARLEAAAVPPSRPRRRGGAVQPGEERERPRHNLTFDATSFVGREAEVAEIIARLRDAPLVTVVGSGGVGKTRTAVKIAFDVLDGFEAGVWFVDLSPLVEESSFARTVARTLGIDEAPNEPALDAVVAYLTRKSLLLIFDNCEHLVAEAARVAEAIVRSCPRVRILATSREPLKIRGEQAYRLGALSPAGAIALFADRATAVDHRFVVTDECMPAVAEICRRLDGIPLAIELAAARVGVLPLKTLADKLDRRFALLTGGDRRALPRQQTLRALIDWSYDLLVPLEQRVFERLAVFAGGCTLAAATRVCVDEDLDQMDVLDVLGSLVDKSLVVADLEADEPRYRLLESSREYAREKLTIHGAWATAAHRHAMAYFDLAERIEAIADTSFDPTWPEALAADLENWLAALEWSLRARGDVELGQRLAGMLRPVWVMVAFGEGREWVRAALDLVDETTPFSVVAQLEFTQARIAHRFAETQFALEVGFRALARFRTLGDLRRTAGVERVIATALLNLGRVAEAEPLLREGLDISRALGCLRLVAAFTDQIGRVRMLQGERSEAHVYYREAIATYRAAGDARNAFVTAGNVAEAQFQDGDVAAALQTATDVLGAYREFGEPRMYKLANIAAYLVALDRCDEADTYAIEALQLARDHGHLVQIALSLQHLAAAAALRPRKGVESSPRARARAARVFGFVDAQLARLGAPRQFTERQEYDRVLVALSETFDTEELMELMAAGAVMSEDQAIDELA